jgi:hypothetical protein
LQSVLTEILSSTANELVRSFASIIDSFAGSGTNAAYSLTSAFTETGEGALDISALSSTKCVRTSLLQVSNRAVCRFTDIASSLASSIGRTFARIAGRLRGALRGVVGEFAQLLGLAACRGVEFA